MLTKVIASMVNWAVNTIGALPRTVDDRLRDCIHLTDYCIPGASDSTLGIRAAVADCSAKNKKLYAPGGDFVFSGLGAAVGVVLPANFPGIHGDGIYRSAFFYTGAGTAFSTGPTCGTFGSYENFSVAAGLPSASMISRRATVRNGIEWQGVGGAGSVKSVACLGFNGFGHKVNDMWDSVWGNLITIECGNDAEYAIDLTQTTDGNNNHSVYTRLQPELSHGKSLRILGLNILVNEIHCERTYMSVASPYNVFIQGDVTVVSGRIENTPGDPVPRVFMGVANGSVTDLKVAGVTTVQWQGSAAAAPVQYMGGSFQSVVVGSANNRAVRFTGATIANITQASANGQVLLSGCYVGDVTLTGSGVSMRLSDGTVVTGGVASGGGNNSVYGVDTSFNTFPNNTSVDLLRCSVTQGATTGYGQSVRVRGCKFASWVKFDSNFAKWDSDSNLYSELRLGTGSPAWNFGPRDEVRGLVDAGLLVAPAVSSFTRVSGERSFRIKATSGKPDYWVYTDAGVWQPMGVVPV